MSFKILFPSRALLLIAFCFCSSGWAAGDDDRAAFAMPDSYSADVTGAVLRLGGNAVDAAVAASFTLSVTLPEAGNIGGGGFMLLRMDDEAAFVDYRETAPSGASRDMYLDEDGNFVSGRSEIGHLSVGVPGTVAGMWEAHQKYGRLPWAVLLAPAIKLAREGFFVHPQLAENRSDAAESFERGGVNFNQYFSGMRARELFKQPELAATLQRISENGAREFYTGETAGLILEEMQRGGGLINASDLADYKVIWREPLEISWRGYRLLSAPPPSSGGIALMQLLQMKDALHEQFKGLSHNSVQYIHLVAEMEKRVFADRAEYAGDPEFFEVPANELVTADYVSSRAAEVNPLAISRLEGVRPGLEPKDTTHFSILDFDGNAVSNTYTLNATFGSGVVVGGAGFLLNDEMDDFSSKPGVPNQYGVVGGEVNAIEPGKRMLSSMSPTILVKDGRPVMVVGTPGGSTIFTSVFQVMVNLMDFDMSPERAVSSTRFHHQLLPPDEVTFDPGIPLPSRTVEGLVQRGYAPRPHDWALGDVMVVSGLNGNLRAAADPRGRGVAKVMAREE
ncbi:MAG: gamma-glutamyltransferase [Chromatiales bacterium]|nr:gamma-glutamyltransferase [Chromatiales bacterium]